MRRLNREMIIQTLVVKLKNLLLLLTGKMHSSPCTTKLFPQQEKFMLVELFNATIVIAISNYAFEYPAFNYSSKLISLIIVRKEFQLHAPELHTPVSSISPYHAGRTSKVPIRYAIEIKKVKRPRINFTMQLYARHTMTCH